ARGLMIDLLEWSIAGAWVQAKPDAPETADRFAADVLDRLRRRIKRRGRKLARLTDADRHEVRILAKKLRYATEFFGPLFDGRKARRRFGAFRTALEALQETLGELNDIATAPVVLARLGLPLPDAEAAAIRRKALLRDAQDAYEALIDTKRFW
ncbi:MAG: CHAD domain-containing protein, partial [Sphingomonas sp.]